MGLLSGIIRIRSMDCWRVGGARKWGLRCRTHTGQRSKSTGCRCQLPSGEWPYRRDMPAGRAADDVGGRGVAAGDARLPGAPSRESRGQPFACMAALARRVCVAGDRGDNAVDVAGPRTVYLGYTLHAIVAVGLASGYKYLGVHDWYRELCGKVVLSQWENGAWGRTE